jgi:HK97 gp10 family phage protein
VAKGIVTMKWYLVYNRIPQVIAAVEANSRTAVKAHADKIAADARRRAPVQTGYLRSSIRAESVSIGKTAQIVVGADYGRFVEWGTYKMAAHPFLTPALEADKAAFFHDVGRGLFKL